MFLLWVRSFDGAMTAQLAFDGENGRPYLDGAIRSRVASWLPLSRDEAGLPLSELARRHPPRMGRMLNEVPQARRRLSA